MKKRSLYHISLIFWVVALMIQVETAWGMCGSTVLWHNLSDGPGGFSPGVVNDVVDQNIDVIGVNALVDGIQVRAETCDILVTVTNGDAVITGSGNRADGEPVGEPRLYLFADTGRTITFRLTDDLLFRGTSDQGELIDLLVSVSGAGEVIFCIEGNESVSFSSTPTTGGTLVVIGMDDPNNPRLVFKRLDDGGDNVEVIVGDRSCITYIAETQTEFSSEEGCIVFDGSNTGTGCTILRIENNASFVVWGHLLTATGGLNTEFLISDIDFAVIAGSQAKLILENPEAGNGTPAFLQVINENCILTKYLANPFCDNAFTGSQEGFILGPTGLLQLNNITYLDYIATKTNTVPDADPNSDELQESVLDLIACGKIDSAQALLKERNASAFIVDGINDPDITPAEIFLNGSAAVYFRSGADCAGVVFAPTFTINPNRESDGAGNIVFDVEGRLTVRGLDAAENGLSVLSLEVTKTGCPVTVESVDSVDQFPERTFARDADGQYLQYNKGAWLVNNRIDFFSSSIIHTDEIHDVFQQENLGRGLASEPTYIGGETFKLCLPVDQQRPTMAFNNSIFRVHTNVGLTGVDLRVPNFPLAPNGNNSIFRFYNNGRAIDNGYGRVAILGTNVGSLSACGQLIDRNTYVDVFQETVQAMINDQRLALETSFNTSCITEGIDTDISGQCAVHSIFMNNASNIQIGTNGSQGIDINTGLPFDLTVSPSFCINGAFFSIDTAGGLWAYPEAGGTTGEGAVFVDMNGTIKILPTLRASFSSMVVRSRNGVIILPKTQVFFTSRVGITQWNVNLEDPNQRVLVPAGECLSDFTMDWGALEKDYTSTNSFVPFDPKDTPTICECPPVTEANLRGLPIVRGTVGQFQVKRSRIGDQFSLLVQGGRIEELVLLSGCNPGEFPGGFLVVEDEAYVGISTAHRNVDSLEASVKLGLNGLLICANGNATINLNEDVLVDNVCPILSGTAFGVNGPQVLNIYSHEEHEFRIKSTGALDLTQFDTENKILQFSGKVRVIFEPGSRLILGGGTLTFTDEAEWTFERVLDRDLLAGSLPRDLDPIRVKLSGNGFIVMEEFSAFNLLQDEFFGIETEASCSTITTITWILNDCAKINVGTDCEPGGAFQIGNTLCDPEASIDVTFVLDGNGACINIGREGFVGFAVGIADKQSNIPNLWLVNCLENVGNVAIDVRQGIIDHRQISTGDSSLASLIAIGQRGSYSLTYDAIQAVIRGGANIALISNCVDDICDEILKAKVMPKNLDPQMLSAVTQAREMMAQAEAMMEKARDLIKTMPRNVEKAREISMKAMHSLRRGRAMQQEARALLRNVIIPSINPVVQTTNGFINANLTVGIMGGQLVWRRSANRTPQPLNVSGADFFAYLVTDNFDAMPSPTSNIAQNMINQPLLGFVDLDIIRREIYQFILGTNGFNQSAPIYSLSQGAVSYNLDDNGRAISQVNQLRGAGSV